MIKGNGTWQSIQCLIRKREVTSRYPETNISNLSLIIFNSGLPLFASRLKTKFQSCRPPTIEVDLRNLAEKKGNPHEEFKAPKGISFHGVSYQYLNNRSNKLFFDLNTDLRDTQ